MKLAFNNRSIADVIPYSIAELCSTYMAPALLGFTAWTLKSAAEKGIHRLYFLARDGYLAYHIARFLCRKYSIQIECRYIYCSRNAWRMPCYHLIGDEAYKLIFCGGYSITPDILLGRVGIAGAAAEDIYAAIGLPVEQRTVPLSRSSLKVFAAKVSVLPTFQKAVMDDSKEAYSLAIGYIRQCGMLDGERFGIVDSGRTGSMQWTLNQLLTSVDSKHSQISGFYFGMYKKPKFDSNSYYTYYFSEKAKLSNKLLFNNNLFEALSFAPHPMTVGYEQVDGEYLPIFNEDIVANINVTEIKSAVCSAVERLTVGVTLDWLTSSKYQSMMGKRLKRIMYKPSSGEVVVLKDIQFSDDVAEGYRNTLIDKLTTQDYVRLSFFHRISRRLANNCALPDMFWSYGSIAASNLKFKWWLRLNVLIWDWLKYVKFKFTKEQ